MIRGVRDNKKADHKLNRSRSRSPINSKANIKSSSKIKNPIGKGNAKSNIKLNRSRSKSPERSIEQKKNKGVKQNLNKSKSQKKLNKSLSQSKVIAGKNVKNHLKPQNGHKVNQSSPKIHSNNNNNSILMKSARRNEINHPLLNNKSIIKQKTEPLHKEIPQNTIKNQEKQMGLIFLKPEHDKVIFKPLEVTDQVFEKYHDMISNDNDTNYVTNALPELISFKKEDDSAGRDFVSGKIARLSGVFDNLTLDKIVSASKKVPQYYNGQCGKNLQTMKIVLQTKFKVQVDLGFLLYSVDGDKLTVFRIYVSKIYRKMNYLGFIYMQIFKMLMSKHPGCDRWSIFILERNVNVHKFFKYLGFKIEKIATQSKNKTVDYFQQFTMKRKELNTVIASMR